MPLIETIHQTQQSETGDALYRLLIGCSIYLSLSCCKYGGVSKDYTLGESKYLLIDE